MDGIIKFKTLAQVAEFLKNFVPSTAKFEVEQAGNDTWVLTFMGGF